MKLSYDLPDTATRKELREGLEAHMAVLRERVNQHADELKRHADELFDHDPVDLYVTVHLMAAELQSLLKVSGEMRGILQERDGL